MTETTEQHPTVANGKQPFAPNPYHIISLDLIDPSPTQPRKTFDPVKMDELIASVKEHGVIEPAIVRAHPKKEGRYELVDGERRQRASKSAGLHHLPALVRDLTDVQVLKFQLIANKDREDIHPLEQAEGYLRLYEKHNVPVKEIAAETGMSASWVYTRFALCKLVPKVKEMYRAGKLSHGAAVAIARVPAALQEEVVKDLSPSWKPKDYEISADDAEGHIRDKYHLKLADAHFDKGDKDLVPAAGACTTCPKRTGNQAELFGDVKSPDTCTDPKCFAAKKAAQWERDKSKAEAEGQKVLSDKESKQLFYGGGQLKTDSKYVDLDAKNFTDSKLRTWSAILGKQKPPVTLAKDDEGNVHKLVSKEAAGLALKKAGGAAAKLAPAKKTPDPVGQRHRREAAIRRVAANRALGLLVAAAEKKGATPDVMRVIASGLSREVWAERLKAVALRRELVTDKDKTKPQNAIATAIKGMKPAELVGLAVELVASRDAYSVNHSSYDGGDALVLACGALGVDWKKCQAEAKSLSHASQARVKAPKKTAKAKRPS